MALMLISMVSSFGVSVAYWDIEPPRPLKIAPGEIKIVEINLQNNLDENDVNVLGELIHGESIASFEDKIYVVKGKTSDMIIPLTIKIPKDAKPGETTKIRVEFKTIPPGTSGAVAMGVGMGVSFDTIVTGIPVQESPLDDLPWGAISIIAVILILGIFIVVLIARRNKIVNEQQRLANFK